MPLSKLERELGINSTELNTRCREIGVIPIYMLNRYYINIKREVFNIRRTPNGVEFIPVPPTFYTVKHRIPVYTVRTDDGINRSLRLDYMYLASLYGPMPLGCIHYTPNEIYDVNKKLYYSLDTYQELDNEIIINGIRFKPVEKESIIYVSDKGVIFDRRSRVFKRYYFDKKYYSYVTHNEQFLRTHRIVYQAWVLNGEKLDSDIPIGHKDGFKNHNWVDNLEATTHKDNYRKAAYEQDLRSTPWTPKIIERMCQLLENGTLGPAEIREKLMSEFKGFDSTYSAVKHKMYEIINRDFWVDISSKYKIDNYKEKTATHNNIAAPDELIHAICKAYVSGKYKTNKELSEAINSPINITNRVIRGEYRTDISSQYNFEYPSRKHGNITEDEVRWICDSIIKDGRSIANTAAQIGRDKTTVRKIIRRELYPEIGKKYEFEKLYPDYVYKCGYSPLIHYFHH